MTAITPTASPVETRSDELHPAGAIDAYLPSAGGSQKGLHAPSPIGGLSRRSSMRTSSHHTLRGTSTPAQSTDVHPQLEDAESLHTLQPADVASGRREPDSGIGEIVGHDAMQADTALQASLDTLQQALEQQKNRPIDREALARVLQRVRFDPLHRDSRAMPSSHRELVSHISDEQLQQWYTALSVTEDEVRGMEGAAYWAGLKIPSSSTAFNIISYVAAPLAFTRASNPWKSVIASLLLVVIQPLVTAPVQSLVIGSVDYRRRLKDPELKLDKTTINSRATQLALKREIDNTIATVRQSAAEVTALFRRHGLAGTDGTIHPDRIDTCVLSDAEKHALTAQCRSHLDHLISLCTLTGQMQALDGAHARQIESTLWQILPRTVRSGSGIATPFIRKPGAFAPASPLGKLVPHKLPPYGVTGVSVCIAMTALIAQHFAAARDEVNGLRLEHKLNMLHADLFAEGKADVLHRRGTIEADDLDIDKCRNMVVSAEANVVLKVADRVAARLALLKNERRAKPADNDNELDLRELEEGRATGAHTLDAKIAAYERDVENLRRLVVTDNLHDDTHALLVDALNGTYAFTWEEAVAKLTKPLEVTSQVSQRIGQTFTLGVLGSAGALAGGRVVSAALKGSDHISLTVQFCLALASALVGLIAASTQGMVTNIKNQRRDAKPEDGAMSFREQTFRGMGAPVEWAVNSVASRQGITHASAAIAEFQQQAQRIGASLERLIAPEARRES
ncbi:hypothetical protein KDW41_25020 [Burkholderia vietnamiensis]|nr:hypothetical protein [Burkholderia vietnamiensis]